MVINNHKQILTDNSCDFKILEDGYRKYTEATETLGYVELIVMHACILQHIYLCISCYVEDSKRRDAG